MRYAVTSNLKDFPKSALRKASALIDLVSCSDDEQIQGADELTINYTPETQNVFISDNKFNIWFIDKTGYKLKYIHNEGVQNEQR